MSRCFPFPPPGYEKKSRAEDADLLKKEKSKEKKHKKDRKEKKEGKEKRDKDKSDDKRREKKDKKKDRDKTKDRDKKKEKAHTSEESRPSRNIGSQNGEEVDRVKHNNAEEKFDSYHGNKITQNTFLSNETKTSKLVLEAGRRIEDSGTAKVEKFAVAQPKRADGMDAHVPRNSETLFEAMAPNKNKKIDERKYNGQGIRHEERFSGNSAVPSFAASASASRSSEPLFEAKELDKNKKIDERKYNGQGIIHEERFSGSSAVPNFAAAATATATASGSSKTVFETKEQIKNKKNDESKYNGQGIRHGKRFCENSGVPSFPSFADTASGTGTATATVESGVAGVFKPLDKSAERRKETSDKIRQKGEEKQGTKHKDRDKEKKVRSKDKEKKKEKKAKEKEKNAKLDKTREMKKDNLLDIHSTNANTSQLPHSNIGAAVEENIDKKRKYFEPNGVLHAIDNRSTKLLKPTSHPLKENGRIVELTLPLSVRPGVTNDRIVELTLPLPERPAVENDRIVEPTLPLPERPAVANDRIVELTLPLPERLAVANDRIVELPLPLPKRLAVANDLTLVSKERKINGTIEPPHLAASSKHKSSGQDDHPQPTAVHKKLPHPDSKYLSVVYSVPKMEELSDSDSQDWLFSSNTSQAMKPELKASKAEEMPHVWAEAMQIESADVYALPYVIPY